MLQGKLSNLRALWVLRVSSVCIGVILLYALISKGTREPSYGAGRGMPFGVEDDVDDLRRHPELHRDPERQLEEEQLAEDLDGVVDAENVAMEQEADRDTVFSLAKMARLLGWGKDPEEAEIDQADGVDDGIAGVVLTGQEHGRILDGAGAVDPDADWMSNPLLRRFMAEFGNRPAVPDSGEGEADNPDKRGEMGDFTTTTTFAGVLPQQLEHAVV